MTAEARTLFLRIARCAVMVDTLAGKPTCCNKVVLGQCPTLDPEARLRVWERKHHLPVPWVGNLEHAPLLFLSSNPFTRHEYDGLPVAAPRPPLNEVNGVTRVQHPSLGRPFEAPKAEWDDDQIADKFEAMFDVWVDPTGTRAYTDEEGALGAASPYWKAASSFARSVFDEPVRAGIDYALTEIVRCKSPEELGVDQAATECVSRYLEQTLALSPAPVLAVFGRPARQAVRELTRYEDFGPVSPPQQIAGRDRTLVFLAHPSSRRSKYPKTLDAAHLEVVRALLANAARLGIADGHAPL